MRNINPEEKTFLIKDKLRSGKDIKQAQEEVERDIEYIRKLNGDRKQLEKEIRDLDYKKRKSKINFDKAFEKMIKQQAKTDSKLTKSKSRFCMTKHLQRILNYLKENPQSSSGNIACYCMIPKDQVEDGLLFLVGHKLVNKLRKNGVYVYFIK